jgi:hypothetical protein
MVMWQREIEVAVREERPIILTCHPEFVGRPGPMDAFARFVSALRDDPRIRFSRSIDIARAVEPVLLTTASALEE